MPSLKKYLKDPEGTPIYALRANGGLYICREAQGRLITQAKFAVSIQAIDTVFLEKFFERIQSLDSDMFDDWEDKIEKIRAAKEEKEGLIRKGIKEADLKMKRINELLTNTDIETPLPKSMIDDLVRQYTGLEAKQAELKRELQENPEEEEENEEILFEIGGLIPRIIALWESLPLEKRVRFIGALVRRVILSRATSGWLKMEIHWKMLDWETDIAHIRRGWSGIRWTREEETHLQEIYSTEDAGDILKAFPTRSWRAIKAKAFQLNLPRLRKEIKLYTCKQPRLFRYVTRGYGVRSQQRSGFNNQKCTMVEIKGVIKGVIKQISPMQYILAR